MATISDMESKLSAGKNDSATLWETEEQALRYLLEDGKLNLCLRSLVEFKKSQTEARKRGKGPMVPRLPLPYETAMCLETSLQPMTHSRPTVQTLMRWIIFTNRSILRRNVTSLRKAWVPSSATPGSTWRCCKQQTCHCCSLTSKRPSKLRWTCLKCWTH